MAKKIIRDNQTIAIIILSSLLGFALHKISDDNSYPSAGEQEK